MLFEILEDNVNENYSKSSLKYISYLGANNYTITINICCPDPFRARYMYFDGCAYKKRSGNTFTVIDSWSHIKKEHWEMFKIHYLTDLNRDSWTELFINESMYISNVLYFEILRIGSSRFDNVKEVIITYDENDYDVECAKQYVYQKMKFTIKFWKK